MTRFNVGDRVRCFSEHGEVRCEGVEEGVVVVRVATDGKQEFWKLFGWCLAWIGFGACVMMANHRGPLVNIQLGPKPAETNQVEVIE